MSIQIMADNLQWRVIGNWSGNHADNGEHVEGAINYGFSTQESALGYLSNLLNIAYQNGFFTHVEFGKLDVSADSYCNMRNFQGSYRVAQYITNN